MFIRLIKLRVCFLPIMNMGLGYDFESISLTRVWYFSQIPKFLVLEYEKFVKIHVRGGFLSRHKILS